MATQQPLTRFSGDPDDPIQPATFLQDFEVHMTELMTVRADLKKEKKSAKSYLASLEGERIMHEMIMKTSKDTNQLYHQWWADRLLRLAKGAEVEKTKQSIGTVWKHLPYALKKAIDEEHDNWEFTSAIKAVKWSVLKVEAEHEVGKTTPLVVPETPRTKLANNFATARISTSPLPSPV
ncbi:hypothetical protein LENED_009896 [Lentinula edodes]|uniref:Uncharacterized protein n=1 Tax=Lentinula edodes TaxID=5353 RepID=A0A1Q3EL03_LENED|nr:hypothetical protein LENED_009896 [Lentinula edodes]